VGAKRILLVDDEALVALAAEDILMSEGYSVVGPADRLESALRLAKNEALDGAVLDINLAGVYVWPVADALFARGVPFVLLTGFGKGLDLPPSCRRVPILTKPVRPQELAAALEGQIARGRSANRKPCLDRPREDVARN
jgi:DNA-binding response OmpR family regulator